MFIKFNLTLFSILSPSFDLLLKINAVQHLAVNEVSIVEPKYHDILDIILLIYVYKFQLKCNCVKHQNMGSYFYI